MELETYPLEAIPPAHAEGFDLLFHTKLDELIAIAVAATGYDLRRSGDVAARANGNVDPVEADTETVTLLAPNGYRRGATVYNDSSAVLYLKLGSGASTVDWSVKLNANDYYETPDGYRGALSGIWTAAAGHARVTEF